MNEWQLLVESEEIEPGDLIVVEKENGKTMRMRFTKIKEGKYVMLKDGLGDLYHFSADSLEEIDGQNRIIVGKYEG
jgi:hypothetical protein